MSFYSSPLHKAPVEPFKFPWVSFAFRVGILALLLGYAIPRIEAYFTPFMI